MNKLSANDGFSYTEILVSIVLISIALIPTIESIQIAHTGSSVYQSLSTQHYHLSSKIEEVLAQPYSSLESAAILAGAPNIPTSYSDSAGENNRRLVFLSLYDGDNEDSDDDPFTGTDAGLLWVRVSIEGTSKQFETLIGR